MYNTIGSHWKGATNNVCMISGVAFSLEYSIKRSIKFDESSLSRFALAGGLAYEGKSKGSVLGSANSMIVSERSSSSCLFSEHLSVSMFLISSC